MCSLILRVKFDGFQKLVFRALVVAHCPHDESPHDPVVRILRILLDTLLDLLDRFGHFSLFEESKCPMSMTIVRLWIIHLGTSTDVYCLLIKLMHIVQKSQIIVGVGMMWV